MSKTTTPSKDNGNSAGIAQLVEHDLAKVGVASSNLVSRSIIALVRSSQSPLQGWMAEWLCSGLQLRERRFDSDSSLQLKDLGYYPPSSPGGEIGRRNGLKIPRRQLRAGSSPAPGTIEINQSG